jgi:hypothetical protein
MKLKGGAVYTEADLENTITANGITFILDKDQPDSPLDDMITMEPIQAVRAVLLNGRVYDIYSIQRWVFEFRRNFCPLRIVIREEDRTRIQLMYERLQNSPHRVSPPGSIPRAIRNRVQVSGSQTSPAAFVVDNIARGDLLLLRNGRVLYSNSWYFSGRPNYIMYGVTSLLTNQGEMVPIGGNQLAGYVLRREANYDEYASRAR